MSSPRFFLGSIAPDVSLRLGSMGIAPCDGIVSPAYFVFDFRIGNHAF